MYHSPTEKVARPCHMSCRREKNVHVLAVLSPFKPQNQRKQAENSVRLAGAKVGGAYNLRCHKVWKKCPAGNLW